MNLFTRFFLLLLLFSLAPVLATGVWMLSSNEAVRGNARQLHRQIAALAAENVEITAGELNRALSFVEDLERGEARSAAHDLKLLQGAAARHSAFALISILDRQGREVLRMADPDLFPAQEYADRGADPIVRRVRATGRYAIGPIAMVEGRPLISVAHPLPQGRSLYALYSLSGLWKRINRLMVGTSGRMILLDADGRKVPAVAEGFPDVRWTGPGPLSGETGWLENIATGKGPMIGAWAAAPSLNLTAMSLQPRAEAYANSDSFAMNAFAFLLALSLFVAAGAFWITGRMTQPLQRLIAGAQRASRGEFEHPVPEIGWGELSILSRNFNAMMGTLREYKELQVDRVMEERAKVTALVHNIPDAVVLAGFDGSILYMNASARSLLAGAEGPAGRHRSVYDLLREPKLRDLALALMLRRKRAETAEMELKGPDGIVRGTYFCTGVTVSGESRDIGILLVMRDVTTERNLDKVKEDFLHSIVHDLRTPLTAISAFMKLMEKSAALSDKEGRYMGYALLSSKRLSELVTDILDMAKLESGTMELNRSQFDARLILESMRGLYALEAESRQIELRMTAGPPPHVIVGDMRLIERVVMNLLGNALKFTPNGGVIELSIGAVSETELEFAVSDTGPGIPEFGLKAVFEKFKQLPGTPGGKRIGYGLGLAICKRVVDLHGGRIWAESAEGKGSRFVFRLGIPAGLKVS